MKMKKATRWGAIAGLTCALLLFGAVIHAQGKAAKKKAVEIDSLSPKECLRKGAMEMWTAEKAGSKVRSYLADAEKKKDIIRINCVREKLTKINTVIELARQNLRNLRRTVPRDASGETSRLLYEKMTIFREQAEGLRRDAESCSGEEMTYTGPTKVTTTVDPTIPQDDPTNPPVTDLGVIGRPPEASPYF